MEELGQALAMSCLLPKDNIARPSHLLSPIHLGAASLLTGVEGENAVMALPPTKKQQEEEVPAAGEDEKAVKMAVVGADKDTVGDEDPEAGEAVAAADNKDMVEEDNLGAEEAVAEPLAAESEGEEPLREGSN